MMNFLRLVACFFLIVHIAQHGVAGDGPSQVLRLQMPRDGDPLLLPVTIQSKTYHFLMDTRVNLSIFDDRLRALLLAKRGFVISDEYGQEDVFAVPAARLSGTSVELPREALCRDLTEASRAVSRQVDGLVGMNFLRALRVELAFDEGVFQVGHFDLPANPGREIQINYEHEHPFVLAKVNDFEAVRFFLDTAFVATGRIGLKTALRMENDPEWKVVGMGFGVGGRGRRSVWLVRNALLALGPFEHQDLVLAFGDPMGIDSVLGLRYLRRYNVICDFKDSVLYLRPSRRFGVHDHSDFYGLVFVQSPEGPVMIDNLLEGSPCDRAGAAAGDLIYSVDGRVLWYGKVADVQRAMLAGGATELLVYRAGKLVTIDLPGIPGNVGVVRDP